MNSSWVRSRQQILVSPRGCGREVWTNRWTNKPRVNQAATDAGVMINYNHTMPLLLHWGQARLWLSAALVLALALSSAGEQDDGEFLQWRDLFSRDDAAEHLMSTTASGSSAAQLLRANARPLGRQTPHRKLTPGPKKQVATARPEKPDLPNGLRLRTRAMVQWDMQCPQWIQDYAALHKQARGSYSAASSQDQLMMHECSHEKLPGCPGLGDRFRGLMETFKFAVHSSRLFLLRWEGSAPLEDVLQPALIDWRVQTKYNVDGIKDSRQYYWRCGDPRPEAIVSGSFVNHTNKLMTLTHADQDCKHQFPGPDIGCTYFVPPQLRSCVFHALFKPSDSLAAYVAETRQQLFGSATERYLAVHLRIGGFEGERGIIRGGLSAGNQSTAEVVALALSAARDLAAASNISAPVLVLTDNDELREQLREGEIPGFVSPSYKARHVSKVQGPQHKDALMTSVADLLLLAQATCFIGSPSGFTYTALLWGRHACYLKIHDKQRGVTRL